MAPPGFFGYVKPNDRGVARLNVVQEQFEKLWEAIEIAASGSSGGRELALCKTNLQQACFWAKKAVCESEENRE